MKIHLIKNKIIIFLIILIIAITVIFISASRKDNKSVEKDIEANKETKELEVVEEDESNIHEEMVDINELF